MSFKSPPDNGAYRHPSTWADPAPGLQALIRLRDECELEVHFSMWEVELVELNPLTELFCE